MEIFNSDKLTTTIKIMTAIIDYNTCYACFHTQNLLLRIIDEFRSHRILIIIKCQLIVNQSLLHVQFVIIL